jgi:hypothetical protein
MITLKIDVTKIDKNRLYKGKKGTYLNAVLIETPNSEHSDYMIVESISKEERESGKKGTIIGEGKVLGQKKPAQNNQIDIAAETNGIDQTNQGDDDLPF